MSQIIPEQYMCYRAKEVLTIDGHLTEASWKRAPCTPLFVDIEGDKKPLPRFATRVAMLWGRRLFLLWCRHGRAARMGHADQARLSHLQ